MSADKLINQKSAPIDPFDPEEYFHTFYSNVAWRKEDGDPMKFFQDCLHEAFSKGNITGTKLLDVGTGPIPNTVFCAAPWFEDITLSDFSQKNLEFLRKWRDGKINHMGPVFEYILQLDKSGSMEERQDELRKKIGNIVFCDITEPNPVASTAVDGVIFDAITCSNCLEVASFTLDDIAKSVRNLRTLLKPGGHFVLEGCLEMSFYRVGELLYECYPINTNQLEDIFKKEGFEILNLQVLNYTPRPEEGYFSDCNSVFAMVTRKVEHCRFTHIRHSYVDARSGPGIWICLRRACSYHTSNVLVAFLAR
ncbi:hypothetical protein CHS0354_021974 [Potamilus streckersoni]|uniref:Indolethylamine N-methyltransferase-like n=1 Tax=Potamilus streckersoni TaxID=2493646 RepID=A0AAE0VXA7_9BIVA|nr:hypothetical protein CHS0354_021974 [Potamilus streckersoni]